MHLSCVCDDAHGIIVTFMKSVQFSHKLIGTASLLAIGVLFGLSGVMAKYLSEWLSVLQVVEYRFAIALVGLMLLVFLLKIRITLKGVSPLLLLVYAVSFPISVILFTLSIFNGSVALAVFSFYTATLVSSFVIGRLFFGEKIHIYKQLALVAVLLSILAFTDPFNNLSLNAGLIFGLLSGIVQGIASGFQKKLSNYANKSGLLLIQCLAGVAVAVVAMALTGEALFVELGAFQWLVAVLFGLAMLAITYLFLIGFKYTNLNTGSILVSTELFFGPFFAFILLAEGLTINIIIGGLLTVVAVILAALDPPKKRKK